MRMKYFRTVSINVILLIFFFIGGLIYVGNAWSPSSYALALQQFGVENTATIVGSPRPIRSDEWAVMTPFTQVTVNNKFTRYNNTSPYHEDLRTLFSMPLLDWGLIFKPTMWLYRLVNPAYAFSFHHYTTFLLFIFGYAWLFIIIGASQRDAFLISSILFFTGFTQYWWSALGGTLAFFPWLIVSLEPKTKPIWKIFLFYWVATCWMLGFMFYVPGIISLAFVAFLILLAFRPQHLLNKSSLISLVIASLASAATVAIYLKDYLINTWNTIYPGQRITTGGGVSSELWISQLLPTSQIHTHESLIGANICEIGTVGSFYILATLLFLNYPKWKQSISRPVALKLIILSTGFLAISAWMLLPVPSWVGAPLLWNRVPADRMLFASGFMLILIIFTLAQNIGLKITPIRVGIFSVLVIASWYYYKYVRFQISFFESWLDVVILVPIFILLFFANRISAKGIHTAVLASVAFVALLSFSSFNPIQSAWSIFNRPETQITKALDRLTAEHPDKPIAVSNFPGAILNGWGYRSISHVLPTPHLEFFRQKFPDLGESKLNEIFNRYAHIILVNEHKPKLLQSDAVTIPISTFNKSARMVKIGMPNTVPFQVSGFIDSFVNEGKSYKVVGWAPWKGENSSQSLYLIVNYPVKDTHLSTMSRPDVASSLGSDDYLLSGFSVEFTLNDTEKIKPDNISLCLVAVDTNTNQNFVVAELRNRNFCTNKIKHLSVVR